MGHGHLYGADLRSIPAWAGGLVHCWLLWRPARSIPAWAGASHAVFKPGHELRVDPRVGGGVASTPAFAAARHGRSPRGRGRRHRRRPGKRARGSIPAWAGASRQTMVPYLMDSVDPRVGGGVPARRTQRASSRGRSPRGRGRRAGSFSRDTLLSGPMRWSRSAVAWCRWISASRNITRCWFRDTSRC